MKVMAATVEALFTALLVVVWVLVGPGDDVYDDPGGPILAVGLLSLFSGWHLLGGWGCAGGCAVQLVRLAAVVVLFGLSMSAYNPHMDNPCSFVVGDCIDNAQRNFRWTYLGVLGLTGGSSMAIFVYALRTREES